MLRALALLLLVLSLACSLTLAPATQAKAAPAPEEKSADGPERSGPAKTGDEDLADDVVVTSHTLKTPAGTLTYTAEAGTLVVRDDSGKDETAARFFYTAYFLDKADPGERPVTFAFNGGPGSSSVWLHLGALGPKVVALGPNGELPPPPARLENNPLTWLAFTDLVFIDPVGTGYSRETDQSKVSHWGVSQDVGSVARFIRLLITRKSRWLSPKYLVGESYGCARAASLASYLQEHYSLDLNGVLLISPALDFATLAPDKNNITPYALLLPSYAAAARINGRGGELSDPLDAVDPEFMREVEEYSLGEYLSLLARGDAVSQEERQALIAKTAELTGLDQDLVEQYEARIPPWVFFKGLLRDQRLILGRMDTTMCGIDPNPDWPWPSYDPALDPYMGAYAATLNDYIRTGLEYENDLPYKVLSPEVLGRWDWSSGLDGGQGYVNTAEDLKDAMTLNPYLKVLVAAGYYDLATPYMATRYSLDHMGLDERLLNNLELVLLKAGHMAYHHQTEKEALYKAVKAFYTPVEP